MTQEEQDKWKYLEPRARRMGSGPPFNWLGPQARPFRSLAYDFLTHKMGATGHESLPVLMSTLVHWEGSLRM